MKINKKSIVAYLSFLNAIISASLILLAIVFFTYGFLEVELSAVIIMCNVVYWIAFLYLLKKTKQKNQDEFNPKPNSLISILLSVLCILPVFLLFGGQIIGAISEGRQIQNRAQWEKENCKITIDKNGKLYECNNGEVFVKINPV